MLVRYILKFFSYVEIRTKIASLLPFLLGLVFACYATGSIHWGLSALFFVSMTFFDMATTALNNYIDTKASNSSLPFRRKTARWLLFLLLALATGSGLLLALLTGPVVFLTGAVCFFIGITYTFGPAPLSRMPLGEVFSGLFMGFFIPFLMVIINSPPDALVSLTWQTPRLLLSINIPALLRLLLITGPAITGIANIMLANNICDVVHDVTINRFTLPYYVGNRYALQLFTLLYGLAAAFQILAALTGTLPHLSLLSFLTWPLVLRNIRRFLHKQDKSLTFPLSVANFILLVLPPILLTALDLLIRRSA